MGKLVMVLSAAAGAGHLRAADALVAAFEARGHKARHLDVLTLTNPLFRRLYSTLYIDLVNKRPDLVGWMYNALDRPWQFQKRRLALDRLNTVRLVRHLTAERPAVAICTHFLPAEILMHLKRKRLLDIPVGIVVTDIDAHSMWLYKHVDWYFVAREETRAHLSALGIPRETIHVTGIPIDPVFAASRAKRETRLNLDLDPDLTTILVSVGGFGVGPVESLIGALQEVTARVQIVVICGKNAQLEKKLRGFTGARHPMKVVGFTREMDSWMAASDLLVGKAGGLTSAEALARGLVLVVVNPIPGQEERNSDHFLEEGVAIRCNNLPALAYKVDNLLTDQVRFRQMQAAVKSVAHPNAAADIAAIVLE